MVTGSSQLIELDRYLFKLAGKAEEKPVGTFNGKTIANGSTYAETDTGERCIYDEEDQKWTKTKSSGGSGGGPKDLDGDGIDDTIATDDDITGIIDDIWPDQVVPGQ